MRIFVVGMPGYGNLGADLISVQLVRHIVRRWPDSEIGLLHGPYSNPFIYPMSANVVIFCKPIRSALKSYWNRKAAIRDFLCHTDLMKTGFVPF